MIRDSVFGIAYYVTDHRNVVTGIGRCMDLLEDSHTDAVTKAKYLSFLIHLIGDIHQPLHCGSLFNSRFTQSDGGKGGNRFCAKDVFVFPRTYIRICCRCSESILVH